MKTRDDGGARLRCRGERHAVRLFPQVPQEDGHALVDDFLSAGRQPRRQQARQTKSDKPADENKYKERPDPALETT